MATITYLFFPDHSPEVVYSLVERSLSGDEDTWFVVAVYVAGVDVVRVYIVVYDRQLHSTVIDCRGIESVRAKGFLTSEKLIVPFYNNIL